MRKLACFLISLLLFSAPSLVFAELPSHPLIEMAKQKEGQRVRYALDEGAQVGLTADGKSYCVLWLPERTNPQKPPPMIGGKIA